MIPVARTKQNNRRIILAWHISLNFQRSCPPLSCIGYIKKTSCFGPNERKLHCYFIQEICVEYWIFLELMSASEFKFQFSLSMAQILINKCVLITLNKIVFGIVWACKKETLKVFLAWYSTYSESTSFVIY